VRRLALAVVLAILAAAPLWIGGTYYVNVASQILLYAIFALGVNVLAGYAGLVSLGHAGLFGIAAYSAAKIMTAGHGHVAVAAGALAVTLGAHFAVIGRGEGAAEIARMAEERGVTRLVMRAPRPAGLLGRLRKDFASEVLERLEGVDLILLADRPDEPKGSGE